MVMLMNMITSSIAKQCSVCMEILPPWDTFGRRVVVRWGLGLWMFTSDGALGSRRRSALPVRREALDRMTAQRLDKKLMLKASISAVKLQQNERVPQALSCLAQAASMQYTT